MPQIVFLTLLFFSSMKLSAGQSSIDNFLSHSEWEDYSDDSMPFIDTQSTISLRQSSDSIGSIILHKFDKKFPLHKAIALGQIQKIKELIKSHDVNQKNKNGNTPLHYYAEYGKNSKIFDLLISNGALVDQQNNVGQTPLMLAIANKNLTQMELLANRSNLNLQDKNGLCALHYAVLAKSQVTIWHLLDRKAQKNIRDHHSRTPINYATSLGYLDMVDALKNKNLTLHLSVEIFPHQLVNKQKSLEKKRGCWL